MMLLVKMGLFLAGLSFLALSLVSFVKHHSLKEKDPSHVKPELHASLEAITFFAGLAALLAGVVT